MVNKKLRSAKKHVNLTLSQSILTQLRVIYALIMRETLTRYGRENIGFLWVVGEPILFCGGVTIMWTLVRPSHEHGLRMTAMVVTGYVPLVLFRHAVVRSTKAYAVNSSLLYHRLVTPLDIITARITLEVIGVMMAAILVLCGAVSLGYMELPEDWALTLSGFGFVVFFTYGISFIFSYLTERSDLLEKTVSVLTYLALPWTGAFVMIDWIPPKYRWVLEYTSPIANGIEMMRSGFFGSKVVPHYSICFMTYTSLLTFMVGLYLCLRVRPHIELS